MRTAPPRGLHYDPGFLTRAERAAIAAWVAEIHPLWEMRRSTIRPAADQRRLLRPVYWLGGWQFACLDYYHPPHTKNRVVRGEAWPAALQAVVARVEQRVRRTFEPSELPAGYRLNTALINLYGDQRADGRREDTARVGEHRDYEPGPVASLSLGERALFQFVTGGRDRVVVKQVWLDDGSLQVFGGPYWKDKLFHRVQRVERKGGHAFAPQVAEFATRRVNLTFRYVPEDCLVAFRDLPEPARGDVAGYVAELAQFSAFWAHEL